ncbi:hypothetical protein GCM10023169_08500 [Georgenia halophila]|uniref:DUF2178 domain-containing protein n=1 Tax=Georgenia halophila TaxID=620889 RepID=A0ABP8KY46_9MICO
MTEVGDPISGARWVIARKRKFHLAAAILLVAVVAVAGWTVLSGHVLAGIVVCAVVLVPALILVVLPFLMEREVRDFDAGRQQASRRRLLKLNLFVSLMVLTSSALNVFGADHGDVLTSVWWLLLVLCGAMAITMAVQLVLTRRNPSED